MRYCVIVNRVQRRRYAIGMKQRTLAAMVGTTQSEISRIEKGKREPGVQLAIRIARALGTTVEELFGGRENE